MKNIAVIIIQFLFLSAVHSQEIMQLTLQQAIQYGLANNKTIQASSLEAALTKYKIKEYQSGLYPNITGNANITHYQDIPIQYIPGNTFDPSAQPDQYKGLKFQLPNVSNVGLTANWLLYDQALYSALKLANTSNRLTDIRIQKDKSELAYNVSLLYYGIVFARKQQESLLIVDSNMSRLIEVLQSQYNNGMIKKSDLDKVKVNRVSIESKIDQIDLVIATQTNVLKLLTGLPQTNRILVAEPDIEKLLTPIIEPSDAEDNFDLMLLRQQITMFQLERRTIIAYYYPVVSAVYSYSYNWASPDLDKVIGSKLRYPQQFVGVNLSVPIFDGNKNLYKIKQNTVTTRQLELKADFLLNKTSTDIANAQLSYNVSLKNVNANSSNVKLGEKLYAENLYEYRQGVISLNDVLATENALQQALAEYFGSVSAAFTALLEYKKTTNTILANK